MTPLKREESISSTYTSALRVDQVREFQQQWSFDDFKAHHMSVLAMQQMALLFQGIHSEMSLAGSPDEIKLLLKQRKVVIWSPEINILNNAGIPASWDVTSDSMAAWLANKLYATNLTLVKSAEIPQNYFVSELTEKGIVDRGVEFSGKFSPNVLIEKYLEFYEGLLSS